jgi:ribosomal protein S18 acetylase RimI-like enzyme
MISLVIRPLQESDIAQVVALHRAVLGYSVNALLGTRHLAFVYRTAALLPATFVHVALEGGTVVGAVSATLNESRTARALLQQMPLVQRCCAAARLACSPSCVRALWRARRTTQPVIVAGLPVAACLTSIVVAPHTQGRGVGRALVARVDDFMRQHAVARYRLDTRLANRGACAFYTRLGFCEHERRGSDIIFLREL